MAGRKLSPSSDIVETEKQTPSTLQNKITKINLCASWKVKNKWRPVKKLKLKRR